MSLDLSTVACLDLTFHLMTHIILCPVFSTAQKSSSVKSRVYPSKSKLFISLFRNLDESATSIASMWLLWLVIHISTSFCETLERCRCPNWPNRLGKFGGPILLTKFDPSGYPWPRFHHGFPQRAIAGANSYPQPGKVEGPKGSQRGPKGVPKGPVMASRVFPHLSSLLVVLRKAAGLGFRAAWGQALVTSWFTQSMGIIILETKKNHW